MAIRIIGIKPTPLPPFKEDIEAHLSMDSFIWQEEATQKRGETPRDEMYDWIVSRGGKAYVRKVADGQIVYIFGALSNGKKYIRTAEDRRWTNELIELQRSSDKPPGSM